jgi:myo-inositol-1(or 4)-monophosphatase
VTAAGGAAELAAHCLAAAEAGARVLRDLFDQPREVRLKGRIDLVTDADRAAEERILALLRERAPGVAVLAEESGAHAAPSEARFIVDPLDGTTNYAHGIPLFCCTVAAELDGKPVAGCTIDPVRGERFRGARGLGAYLGPAFSPADDGSERRLVVASARSLEASVVCTGFPYERREELSRMVAAFGRFTELCRGTRRLGSAALDLAYVAAGRLDAFFEMNLQPWDVATGQVLVEEAGGLITRYDGSPHQLGGGQIVASNPALAEAVRAVLLEARAGRP